MFPFCLFSKQGRLKALVMCASNTSRHLEDSCSFTKGKRDTCSELKPPEGLRDLQIEVPNSTAEVQIKVLLKDALHARDLCLTVMSIGRILRAGYTVQSAGNSCGIKKGEDGRRIIGRKQIIQSQTWDYSGILAEPVSTFSRSIVGTRFSHPSFALLLYSSSITGSRSSCNRRFSFFHL